MYFHHDVLRFPHRPLQQFVVTMNYDPLSRVEKQMGITKSKPAQATCPPPANPVTKPAAVRTTESDLAVLELKEQRDQLNRAARRAVKLTVALNGEAARWLKTESDPLRKEKALRCLKRRKIYEQQLDRIEKMQENVEVTLNQVETARFDASVFKALKAGGDALKALTKDMGDVEKAMDDIADAVADAQAVSALLAEQLDVDGIDLSDEAMEEELLKLSGVTKQKTKTDVELPVVPDHPVESLPKVPDHDVVDTPANVFAPQSA